MENEELQYVIDNADVLYDFVLTRADGMQKPHIYGGVPMSMVCAHTLCRVAKNPGMRVGDVAVMWGHTRGAATRNVDRLRELGLLEKRKEEGNRKEVRLYPTPRGEEFAREHEKLDLRTLSKITEALLKKHTFSEVKTCCEVMDTFREIFKEEKL